MLDAPANTRVSTPQHDVADRLVSSVTPCGSRRWHCVWTHPQAETRALYDIHRKAIPAYLPMHATRTGRIVPLFSRYLFVQFDPAQDQWRRIYRSNGVGGLICHAPERPTPLPHGVVEHLLARTSQRGVVDDPATIPRANIPRGAAVSVLEGPLAGLEGVCSRTGPERVLVLLRLFAGVVPVSLPVTNLQVIM